ncbi:MAG: AMP-binding protein, partial [Chloroflexi bacterium]|nr:AMP-binding protein [Chloroflexota bacterium]
MATSPFPVIKKPSAEKLKVRPNLDYDAARASFRWEQAYEELDWLPGGFLNMAHEAIDRHANGRNRDRTALIWEGRNGEREDYTFGDLRRESNRFANVLKSLGIEKGDRVFIFMDRLPELYVAFFGILKIGAIAGPLFAGFGPDTIKARMKESGAKVLVTQPELRRKITDVILELFELQHILIVNKNGRDPYPHDMQDLDYYEEMGKASADFDIVNTSQYDLSIMQYTSGTTGKPKAVLHCHLAVVQHHVTGKWALDLHPDDVFWCTADPGWITGTSYGMLAPWTNGVTQLVYEGGFQASAWYEL